MDEKMERRLQEWLETSGRGLELRAARVFRHAGAQVQASFSYSDSISSQLREADLVAKFCCQAMMSVSCSIGAVIECKSSKKYPWLAFYDHTMHRARNLESLFTFAHGPFSGVGESLLELWEGEPPFDQHQVATHAVATFAGDTGHDPTHDALRQVLSAPAAAREDYIKHQAERRVGLLVMPVVVIEAPLVRCHLDNTGAIQLTEIDLAQVCA